MNKTILNSTQADAAHIKREAAIQRMRDALESAYCHTFNSRCEGNKEQEQEHEDVHYEIIEALGAADSVGIKSGERKPFEDAHLLKITEIIQNGITHEVGAAAIARAIIAGWNH